MAALFLGEFAIRAVPGRRQPVAAIAGGIVLGCESRLCFASAYRDIFVRGARSGRKAAAVASGPLLQAAIFLPLALGGTKLDYSLGAGQGQLQVVIGGFLFGTGAVLLGGCIFSSAYRAGAGQVTAPIGWLSTVFVGMPLLTLHWDFWDNAVPRYLLRATLWDSGPGVGLLIAGSVPAAWLLYALRVDGALPRFFSKKRRAAEGA